MDGVQRNIIAHLQRDILRLQGQSPAAKQLAGKVNLGPVLNAFPYKVFPTGAVHEYITDTPAATAATAGFVAGILNGMMRHSGPCIWISPNRVVFPPGLRSFGLSPDRILFVNAGKKKDLCWAMETCLQMDGLSAVVGELPDLDFTASRRLQLAVEKSGVTGFVLRQKSPNLHPTACVSRWQITPLASYYPEDLPGVGLPCWRVELLKIRGGKPGSWQLFWVDDAFRALQDAATDMTSIPLRKIS